MVNKRFWLGILVMALIFGMAVIGCDNGTTDSGSDDSLNGTWVSGSGEEQQEAKFDNGNIEMSMGGTLAMKGTYTTSDGKITMSLTSVHGDFLTAMSEGSFELDSKWYSKDDLKAALIEIGMPADSFEESFGGMFSSSTATYSVSGNTLTMTDDNTGNVTTATRK